MIKQICEQLFQVVDDNLARAHSDPPAYNAEILKRVLDNRDPHKPDLCGILEYPNDAFISALFMLILYHSCNSIPEWEGHFAGLDEITAKKKVTKMILFSREGQLRKVRLANDPLCVEQEENHHNNIRIPFTEIS